MEDHFSMARGGGKWFGDDLSTVGSCSYKKSNAAAGLTGGETEAVTQAVESSCKDR